MKLHLDSVSVQANYINAIYSNGNGEDIYCQLRSLGDLQIWWGNMDIEIRRQLKDRLEPGCFDDIDALYKEKEIEDTCPVCGGVDSVDTITGEYCGTCGCDK